MILEGFNTTFGWHAYIMYGKAKIDNIFNHHFVRGNLLQIWLNQGKQQRETIPLWIGPEEVIQEKPRNKEDNIETYQDLLKIEANHIPLKTEEELNYKYNWWKYLQIKHLFNKDFKNMDSDKKKQS